MSNRDMYIEKAKAKLDKLKAEIDRLDAETEEVSADAEIKRREAVKLVQQKQTVVEDRVKELQNSTEHAWDDVLEGFDAAWRDLTAALERARERYAPAEGRS